MANWAIVIGIDRYPASQAWALHGAVRDALHMRTWLLKPGGGNVPPANLYLLLGPDPGALPPQAEFMTATYDNIVSSIDALLVKSDGRGERLFFHFSGHGLSINTDLSVRQGILASDFSKVIPTHSLTVTSLFELFQGTHFKQQFFIIDACRNIPFEGVRLGEYPNVRRPVSPVSPQFVIYATQPGAKAIEVGSPGDESGAFTSALLEGLNGAGAAKVWDDEKEEYVVRWSALFSAVAEHVKQAKHRADASPGGPLIQEPRQFGERADEDPDLGRFPKTSVPNEELSIALVPSPQILRFASIKINELRGLAKELRPPIDTVPIVASLPPRIYGVSGEAEGYRPSKFVKVLLYKPSTITLEFEQDTDASLPGDLPGPGTVNPPGGFSPSSVASYESLEFASEGMDDLSSEELASSDVAGVIGQTPAEALAVPLQPGERGAFDVEAPEPLALIQVANEAGVILATQRGRVVLQDLAFGFYTIRLISPEGVVVTEVVETPKPGGTRRVALTVPPSRSPAMDYLLSHAGFQTDADGSISPSETVGPMAFLKLSTVLALAAAAGFEAKGPYGQKLRRVPLPSFHKLAGNDASSGLYLVLGDERNEGFWESTNAYYDFEDQMNQGSPEPRLLNSFALDAGHGTRGVRITWLDQEAVIFYRVLPGRVTIIVITREIDGSIEVHQYMPNSGVPDGTPIERPTGNSRDPNFGGSAFAAIRRIEYMQRAFAQGRISPLKPDIELLLEDKWVDPIAGCLGAYLAVRLGMTGDLGIATANLVRYFGELPDAHVLRGTYLLQAGLTDEAHMEFSRAIEIGAPIFRDGVVLLGDHALSFPVDEETKELVRNAIGQLSGGLWSMTLKSP